MNFGSSEEFGDVHYSPQDEKHPPSARSPYGASKVAARQLVKVYREGYDLYALQCWCFNFESPRRGEEFVTRKITKGVARIHNDIKHNTYDFDPIQLGNMDAQRDWSHALDIADGVWRMLNQPKDVAKEYVFSSGETHTIKSFVEKAFGAAGIKGVWWKNIFGRDEYLLSTDGFCSTKAYVPMVVVKPKFYRPAEVELLLGDSSLARSELGWAPKFTLDRLVESMVKSDIENYEK